MIQKGEATEKQEVKVARVAAFVIGFVAILLAIPAKSLNIAFLVALAFAVAASANLPSLIFNLFWRRFNTRGAAGASTAGWSCASGWCSSRQSSPARSPETGEPHCSARHRLRASR